MRNNNFHPLKNLKNLSTCMSAIISMTENGKQTPVDESECSPEKRPLTSRTCPTQCKTDCTVSIWSQWSQCKVTDCDSYVRRRRNNKKTGMLFYPSEFDLHNEHQLMFYKKCLF